MIILTARTEESDKIVGQSVGADNSMTKPFSARELVARAQAALRGPKAISGSSEAIRTLSFQHVRLEMGARTALVEDRPIELTAIEFDLLKALAENRGRLLSREQLLDKVWGGEYFGGMGVVDVHLGNEALMYAQVGAVVAAVIPSLVLSRNVIAPVQAMALAPQRIANGQ